MPLNFVDEPTQKVDREAGLYQTYVMRPIAAPLTNVVLRTKITPVTVTLIGLVLGVISSAVFAFCATDQLIWAALFWHLVKVLDFVDGNLARARNQKTYAGKMLDGFADLVVNLALLVGVGLHLGGNQAVIGLALANLHLFGAFGYFRYNSFYTMMRSSQQRVKTLVENEGASKNKGVSLSETGSRIAVLSDRLQCELVPPSVILFSLLGEAGLLLLVTGSLMGFKGILMLLRSVFGTLKNLNVRR